MSRGLKLFEGFGVELEYMIVRRDTLDVLPVADRLLELVAQGPVAEAELGPVGVSNELVLHVLELKNDEPVPSLDVLPGWFAEAVAALDPPLEALGAVLLPTGMHPWMRPATETHLWPHEQHEIYEAFDRIFDCRRHGWANVQSAQLNLSFQGDAELGRLHSALRLVLPLLPALAASSPYEEGRASGLLDTRLEHYRTNCARIPSLTGAVIPEPVLTRRQYETEILERLYRDLAPYDPDGVLRHLWVNARGVIAHFDRDAIEVRVVDMQECPAADIAIAAATSELARALVAERWIGFDEQTAFPTETLARLLRKTIADADRAVFDVPDYARAFGLRARKTTAGDLWRHIVDELGLLARPEARPLATILDEGPLARRLLRAAGAEPSRKRLAEVYRELGRCLHGGTLFRP